jgi:hypothetical protein
MHRRNPLLDLKEFSERPSLGQFARDGCWEQAWSFDRESIPTDVELCAYLEGASEVAFEVFFNRAFIGARSQQEPLPFARACITSFERATCAADAFGDLEANLVIGPMAQTFEFAEIGAVNAWKTVGPFRIDPLKNVEQFDGLWTSIEQSTVAIHEAHDKAIEFGSTSPIPHWIALPASASHSPHLLNRNLIRNAILTATVPA